MADLYRATKFGMVTYTILEGRGMFLKG